MSSYNAKNEQRQGGDVWAINGTLLIGTGGAVVPASGTQAAHIANATGAAGANPTQAEYAALVASFNALVAACQGVGILAAS